MPNTEVNISLKSKSDPAINITTLSGGFIDSAANIVPTISFINIGSQGPSGAAGEDGDAIIQNNSITQSLLANNSVGSNQVIDESIGYNELAIGSVRGNRIMQGAILTISLADDSVTQAKLANNSVGPNQIINGTISTELLQDLSVEGSKVQNLSIQTGKLQDLAITTIKLRDRNVTYAKMQNLATANRVLGSTSAGVIGETQIVTNMIATNAVTEDKLASSLLGEIDANTVKVTDKHYAHTQGASSASWVVNHNLNKFPSVTVVDSAGTAVVGQVDYGSENQVTLTFKASFSGKAYFN